MLRDLYASQATLDVSVSSCLYKCCGGGWQPRPKGTYRGTLAKVHDASDASLAPTQAFSFVILHWNVLGRIQEMLAEVDNILSIDIIESGVTA